MKGFKLVQVVNRSTVPLEVMADGMVYTIRPGYTRDADGKIIGAGENGNVLTEPLPYFAAEKAKRQNPIMGTGNPYDGRSFTSLIAVPEWGDDYAHAEQSDAIEMLDRSQLPEDRQINTQVPGVTVNVRKIGGGHLFRAPGRPKRDENGRYVGGNVRNSDLMGIPPGTADNALATLGGNSAE